MSVLKRIGRRFADLIDVKTIVTFLIVGGYVGMTVAGYTVPDGYANLTMVVVAFYFGTQHQKAADNTVVPPDQEVEPS